MRAKLMLVVVMVALMGNLILLSSCSGSGGGVIQPPPPDGNITISPTSATVIINKQFKFTASSSATWSVNGVAGGNAEVGTVGTDGIYTAPNFVPNKSEVTVTATANSSSAAAKVTLTMAAWSKMEKIDGAGGNLLGITVDQNNNIIAVGDGGNGIAVSYDKNGNRRWANAYTKYSPFSSIINRGNLNDVGGKDIIVTIDGDTGAVAKETPCPAAGYLSSSSEKGTDGGVFVASTALSNSLLLDSSGVVDCASAINIPYLQGQSAHVLSVYAGPDHFLLAGDFAGGVNWNRSSFVMKTD